MSLNTVPLPPKLLLGLANGKQQLETGGQDGGEVGAPITWLSLCLAWYGSGLIFLCKSAVVWDISWDHYTQFSPGSLAVNSSSRSGNSSPCGQSPGASPIHY